MGQKHTQTRHRGFYLPQARACKPSSAVLLSEGTEQKKETFGSPFSWALVSSATAQPANARCGYRRWR